MGKEIVCVVSSCGGHLTEVREFLPVFRDIEHYYILNDVVPLGDDMLKRTFFVSHSERDWKVFLNLLEFYRIFKRYPPTLILSTGAGPAVPAALVGIILGIPTIFVESVCRVTRPSLSGRIMYFLAAHMYYQWPALRKYFPKATYGGPIL
jgi:beta-1,4-N-acetylglucosaminyltransferase